MRTITDVSARNKPGRSECNRRLQKVLFFAGVYLCYSCVVLAQTPDSAVDSSNRSWAATTESKADYGNPTRTFESHTQNGDRTVDVRSLQTRGPDGNYTPYQDIETETVRVNASTSRTTTRTFVRDSDGAKTLFQVTAEEKQTLPGGSSKAVRTTSNPDANGRLQVVQREVQETQKTSSNVEVTKTVVMLASINGGLAPAMQMQQSVKRGDNTVETQETKLLPDGAGNWQVSEVRQTTIKDEGKDRTTEERVSRPDFEGKLHEISRTVSKESEDASGVKHNSEEAYSTDVPGAVQDSSLHLVGRVTTTQRTGADGQKTTKVAEQANPGDPGAGLIVTTVNTDTVRSGSSGAQGTRTIQLRDANGSLNVISVDMTKSDSAKAIEVQIAPAKPK
jgi:hypothetical protein